MVCFKSITYVYIKMTFYIEKINPFHATGLFLYPLKKSENQRFSVVFRGYRKRPAA